MVYPPTVPPLTPLSSVLIRAVVMDVGSSYTITYTTHVL